MRGVFARVPLAFTFGLNAGAIDEQVQRASATSIGQTHIQRLLAAAQGAEIRHRPVQTDQTQQALPQWQTKTTPS